MNLKETIENITNQHISEGLNRELRVRNSIEKTSAARNATRPSSFQHTDAEHGTLIHGFQKKFERSKNVEKKQNAASNAAARAPKPSLLGRIGSGIKKVVGLKEYYKEILNNLLMTEVTASPKIGSVPWAKPVEVDSSRHKRLLALKNEVDAHSTGGRANNGKHGMGPEISQRRIDRMKLTIQAKGMNPDTGALNQEGHGARAAAAADSNRARLSGPGNDKRSATAKLKGITDRNAAARLANDD